MPPSNPVPSCFHCTWFDRALDQARCTRHHVQLGHWAVRTLCSDLKIEGHAAWVRANIDPRILTLSPILLYIWIEIHYTNAEGVVHLNFDLLPLDYLGTFQDWPEAERTEFVRLLSEANEKVHHKLGYSPLPHSD